MKQIISTIILALVATLTPFTPLYSQEMPERKEVRRGNNDYNKENYSGAIEHYNKALGVSPKSIEPIFNLGNALVKSEQFDKGEEIFKAIAADSLQSRELLAEAYYNLGNSQFHQEKYEEALESYKQSMRLDPSDQEAKYNYAYTKAILDQQQQEQDQQDQEQEQDQDQNQDQQDQDQNQDQQDQGDDQQDQDQNQDQQDQDQGEDQQDQQEQPQDGQISEQEQQQMLDAIQAQEDKTQDDLKEKAKGVLIRGAKNW